MHILLNKKLSFLSLLVSLIVLIAAILNSCSASKKVQSKSGAQLWAENCQRCHNIPSPSTFSPEKWETIGMHMQSRALLTDMERDKIVAFLKQ
ncbi:MAG: cytochrome c, partial [Ginsengibacter sp.]|jgi:cytochrome c553